MMSTSDELACIQMNGHKICPALRTWWNEDCILIIKVMTVTDPIMLSWSPLPLARGGERPHGSPDASGEILHRQTVVEKNIQYSHFLVKVKVSILQCTNTVTSKSPDRNSKCTYKSVIQILWALF